MIKINTEYRTPYHVYIIERDIHSLARQEFEGRKYNVVKYSPNLMGGQFMRYSVPLKECRRYITEILKEYKGQQKREQLINKLKEALNK